MKSVSKFVLLAKTEAAYGQDAAPGAADMIVCGDPKYGAQADSITRNVARATLTPPLNAKGGKWQTLGFTRELEAAGLDGAAVKKPDWEPLLLDCGFVRTDVVVLVVDDVTGFAVGDTVDGGTSLASGTVRRVLDEDEQILVLEEAAGSFQVGESVGNGGAGAADVAEVAPGIEYRPTSDIPAMKSSTLYFWHDGIKHALLGVRGSFSLDLKAGQHGMFTFAKTGLWADPADAAMPALAAVVSEPPLVERLDLRLGDYAPVAEALQFDLAANVVRRKSVNAPEGLLEIIVNDRAPKGSFNPEAEALADWNPWPLWKDSTGLPMRCRLGTGAGYRIRLDWAKAALDSIGYGDRDKTLIYDVPLMFSGDGDDELILTIY